MLPVVNVTYKSNIRFLFTMFLRIDWLILRLFSKIGFSLYGFESSFLFVWRFHACSAPRSANKAINSGQTSTRWMLYLWSLHETNNFRQELIDSIFSAWDCSSDVDNVQQADRYCSLFVKLLYRPSLCDSDLKRSTQHKKHCNIDRKCLIFDNSY